MSLFSLIFGGSKPKTASIAKERLQLIIAHERNESNNTPDFLPALQQELMAVISKYVSVNPEDIKVSIEKQMCIRDRVYCPKKALSVDNKSGWRAFTVICGKS